MTKRRFQRQSAVKGVAQYSIAKTKRKGTHLVQRSPTQHCRGKRCQQSPVEHLVWHCPELRSVTRFLSWCGQGGIGSCRRGDTIQLARSCSQFARSSLPLENVPKKYFIGTALGKAREKRENRMVFYESWRKEKIVWFPMKAGGKRK